MLPGFSCEARGFTPSRLSRFSCEARASDGNTPGRRRKKWVPYVYSGGVNIENVAVFQESSSSVSGSESWGVRAV